MRLRISNPNTGAVMKKLVFLVRLSVILLPSLVYAQANGKLQIHFMDVGQGDGAILISPNGETVLFDDGVLKHCDKPVAYLEGLGITRIDYHITSHYHSDHIGCASQVLQEFPLQKDALDRGGSYDSAVYESYVNAVGSHRKTATEGMTVTLDSGSAHPVIIKVVALNGNGIHSDDENDLGLDAVVQFGEFKGEIGGDLSGFNTDRYKDIESSVAPKVGRIDVYKVHHHGSSHSTNPRWLHNTTPKVAVISCGDGNSYGHPTQETIEALHKAGVMTYWTETGNGVPHEPGRDIVGGTIVVQVPADSKNYTVTYNGNQTDTYSVWGGVTTAASNCRYVRQTENWEHGNTPPQGRTLHAGCPQ